MRGLNGRGWTVFLSELGVTVFSFGTPRAFQEKLMKTLQRQRVKVFTFSS